MVVSGIIDVRMAILSDPQPLLPVGRGKTLARGLLRQVEFPHGVAHAHLTWRHETKTQGFLFGPKQEIGAPSQYDRASMGGYGEENPPEALHVLV